MQDRLLDLKQAVAGKETSFGDLLPPRASAVVEARRLDKTDIGVFEAQAGGTGGEDKDDGFMSDYLSRINVIKAGIAEVHGNCEKIRQLKQQMVITASPPEEQKLSNELQNVIQLTNRAVLNTKKALETLKQENNIFRSRHADSSEARIRENMHLSLTRKFKDLLNEYHALQSEYKKAVKDKIERQVRVVYPDANDREVQELVDDVGGPVAAQAIRARMTGAHENLQYAVQDIEMKHKDVRRLEQSVAELHQMFVDLATLVDAQGELLDQIDFSVRNAKDYTEKADKDLVQARAKQAKSKKLACWISTCLIIVAIIVILPVVVYLSK